VTDTNGQVTGYKIPDMTREIWLPTNPPQHGSDIAAAVGARGPRFRRVIKMLKHTTLDSTPESTPVIRNEVCMKPGMLHACPKPQKESRKPRKERAPMSTTNGIFINSARSDQLFAGWSEVQGGGRTDAALAAAALDDRLYLVGKGIDDNKIYINSAQRERGIVQPFVGWAEVRGGGRTDAALAAAAFGDRLYLVAKGIDDNKIYINSARQDQPFEGWSEVQGGGRTDAALAAAAFGDRLYLVGKGI
jgi:hypothetical protein